MNKEVHIQDTSEPTYTDLIAVEMVTVYEDNMGWHMGQSYVTADGMEELADLFEEVPIPLRAIVFGKFINELEARGIAYDKDTFKRPN